jgi:transketolase
MPSVMEEAADMIDIKPLEKNCSQIRRDIVRMTHGAKSGHPGGSLGCTEYFVALYYNLLKHNPEQFTIDGIGQDLFFLSNGHISPVWYSTLARTGYFNKEELSTFRKLNSRLQGHPATEEGLPGIRIASGSLGQGLSAAAGAALAKKLNEDPNFVYVLMGDGETQEGQVWEAAMFTAKYGIDNLIATIDYNGRQIDGDVDDIMPLGDLGAKWHAFGWDVIELEDGNQLDKVIHTLKEAKDRSGQGKPVMILMRTEMGAGVDFMMGTHKFHGVPPNDEQLESALGQLEETLGDY